jgi:hypothetical protein
MLRYVLFPSDVGEMAGFYFVWMAFFLVVNVIWDIRTQRTPPFHMDRFKEKYDVVYNAATFCSGLLILVGLVSPTVRQLAKDTTVPLILAGFASLLRALPAICPYKSTDIV